MKLPVNLLVITRDYSGEYECRNEKFKDLFICDLDIAIDVVGAEWDKMCSEKDGIHYESNEEAFWDYICDLDLQIGAECQVELYDFDLNDLQHENLTLLHDYKGAESFLPSNLFKIRTLNEEVYKEFKSSTQTVIDFAGTSAILGR